MITNIRHANFVLAYYLQCTFMQCIDTFTYKVICNFKDKRFNLLYYKIIFIK